MAKLRISAKFRSIKAKIRSPKPLGKIFLKICPEMLFEYAYNIYKGRGRASFLDYKIVLLRKKCCFLVFFQFFRSY